MQKDKSTIDLNSKKNNYKIITDEPAKYAYNFKEQSEKLSHIIVNSYPRFTVGIFGEWGTGKTTMMKMIKSELENMKIISWKDIEQDSEKNKLKKFIKDTYKIDWICNAECKKVDDKILIQENPNNYNKFLRDNKDTYSAKQSNEFSLEINEKKAILKSNDGKILKLKIKKEDDKNKNIFIYLPDQRILTIWFDAWKYENEEFSALVPLVRTIILHLEEYVTKFDQNVQRIAITNLLKKVPLVRTIILHLEEYVTKFDQNVQRIAINNLLKNFKKMGESIIRNSSPTFGFEKFGATVSVETDINKVLHDYKSEGSFIRGENEIRFYKHISERIEDELKKIRESDEIKKGKKEENVELEEIRKFKLVIFIDDLDRCTPDRALEILESIKTFFDIEGIVYVIGMDPATIDPIIHTKYGENSKINGLDYLQKIVQLPSQIPLWNDNDLKKTVEEMAVETGLPKDITNKLLEKEIIDLIINSAKLNPRNIKRFINSLVLSYDIHHENLEDIKDQDLKNYIIEKYLKSMICIQTFYFRGEKWLQFIKMIIDYFDRVQFLKHFITFIESQKITSYEDLEDKIKDIPTLKYPKYNKKILEVYNKIIEIKDEDLFTFLKVAAESLLRIDNIENYLRTVDTKKDIDTAKNILPIKGYESINKLQDGIEEFNNYRGGYSDIHLPFLELELCKSNKLQKINLSRAFLFKARLSGAILSGAKLSAILSGADLSGAKLSGADLSGAKLLKADLSEADLSGAKLLKADLSEAFLLKADLLEAKLLKAKLLWADLSEAFLLKADFSEADLLEADLSGANLSEAKLLGAKLLGANLSEAKLSLANLSGAN